MRRSIVVVTVTVVGMLTSGCSVTTGQQDRQGASSPSARPSPSAEPEGPDAGPLIVPADDPPPCPKIRAGIDAFNQGDPETTVRRFEEALPLARDYAAETPGRTSALLLEAVRYYAALPPQDYARALVSSPEFKRHQIVTLGVCRYGTGRSPSPAPSPGIPSDDAQTA